MSITVNGGAGKRQRGQQVEEEDAPSSLQVTAHAVPLTLLAVYKLFHCMLVLAQLCSPQGVALFSFVRSTPRVPRPFAGAPVYAMSLTHAERLCAVGCGFKGRLVRLLSLGVGRHFEPHRTLGACRKMMQFNVRRVAAGLAAAVRNKFVKEAEELCASGRCADSVVPLQRAIDFGDLPSRALKAWLHIDGREGVAKDWKTAFELAEEGAGSGCHHCQGVLAMCYFVGVGCNMDEERSLDLASKSSRSGSKYGYFVLGEFMLSDAAATYAQADAFYRLAAAQDLDAAKFSLGEMFHCGCGVLQDHAEALRWYQLAAVQGFPQALFNVGLCHELGQGVRMDVEEARSWYRRAQAAGHPLAVSKLQHLVYGDPVLCTNLPLALPVAGEGGRGGGTFIAGCGWDMGAEIE